MARECCLDPVQVQGLSAVRTTPLVSKSSCEQQGEEEYEEEEYYGDEEEEAVCSEVRFWGLQKVARSAHCKVLCVPGAYTRKHKHACTLTHTHTHARTHAHTHTHSMTHRAWRTSLRLP